MSEMDVPQTFCGQECTSYLIEGGYACQRCADQLEREELQDEADFFRDNQMGDEYGND